MATDQNNKNKLWLWRLTELTVGTWWIEMSHLASAFSCNLHLFVTYKCTRQPLLGNLIVVDRVFFGRLRPEDI